MLYLQQRFLQMVLTPGDFWDFQKKLLFHFFTKFFIFQDLGLEKDNLWSWKAINKLQSLLSLQILMFKVSVHLQLSPCINIINVVVFFSCYTLICTDGSIQQNAGSCALVILYFLAGVGTWGDVNRLMCSDELMRWDVLGVYIVLDLLEDTSVVSLASFIKVKAAVGLHENYWVDEPALQNWVIGSAYSIWQNSMYLCRHTCICINI